MMFAACGYPDIEQEDASRLPVVPGATVAARIGEPTLVTPFRNTTGAILSPPI